MTPLERIKTGILTNDMEEVIQGYMALTGEEVRPAPKRWSIQRCENLHRWRSKNQQKLDFSRDPTNPAGKKRIANKSPVSAGANQFTDDGVEHSDVKTPDFVPTPRKRAEAKTVNVKCHVCGENQEVNPMLAQGDFYRCDSCVGKK
jgi:alpha-tubulin suppressor-like RCC1 family protein